MSLRAFIAPRAAEPTSTTVAVSARPDSARASSTGFTRALSSRALVIWIHQRGDLVQEGFKLDRESFEVCLLKFRSRLLVRHIHSQSVEFLQRVADISRNQAIGIETSSQLCFLSVVLLPLAVMYLRQGHNAILKGVERPRYGFFSVRRIPCCDSDPLQLSSSASDVRFSLGNTHLRLGYLLARSRLKTSLQSAKAGPGRRVRRPRRAWRDLRVAKPCSGR